MGQADGVTRRITSNQYKGEGNKALLTYPKRSTPVYLGCTVRQAFFSRGQFPTDHRAEMSFLVNKCHHQSVAVDSHLRLPIFPHKQQQQMVIDIPKSNQTRQRSAIHSGGRKKSEVFSECQNTCRRQRTYESSQEMCISLTGLSGANNPQSIQVISSTITSLQSMKTFSFLV